MLSMLTSISSAVRLGRRAHVRRLPNCLHRPFTASVSIPGRPLTRGSVPKASIIFATGNNIWGVQSERWGRKLIIQTGLIGYALGTVLFTRVFYLGFEGILAGSALVICLTLARMFQSTLMSAATIAGLLAIVVLFARRDRPISRGGPELLVFS